MSLLDEIQNDLGSPAGDVMTVLLKCKILAARLGSAEFAQWVTHELNGYPEDQPIPDYRRLGIIYFASFIDAAWRIPEAPVPIQLVPEKYRDSFERIDFRDGIAKASSFMSEKHGVVIHRPELIFALQGVMYPGMNCHRVWGRVSAAQFKQLVSVVKSRILDFVLEVAAENPEAGDAPINSHPLPPEKLRPLVNNFFGSVGNVAQQSHDFTQTTSIGITTQELTALVAELTAHIEELGLDSRQRQKAEAQDRDSQGATEGRA